VQIFEDIFIRFDRIHEHDGQTDSARRHRPRLRIASRGKTALPSVRLSRHVTCTHIVNTTDDECYQQIAKVARTTNDQLSPVDRRRQPTHIWRFRCANNNTVTECPPAGRDLSPNVVACHTQPLWYINISILQLTVTTQRRRCAGCQCYAVAVTVTWCLTQSSASSSAECVR